MRLRDGVYFGKEHYIDGVLRRAVFYVSGDSLSFDMINPYNINERRALITGRYSINGNVLQFQREGKSCIDNYSFEFGEDDCFMIDGAVYRLDSPPPEGYEFRRTTQLY